MHIFRTANTRSLSAVSRGCRDVQLQTDDGAQRGGAARCRVYVVYEFMWCSRPDGDKVGYNTKIIAEITSQMD